MRLGKWLLSEPVWLTSVGVGPCFFMIVPKHGTQAWVEQYQEDREKMSRTSRNQEIRVDSALPHSRSKHACPSDFSLRSWRLRTTRMDKKCY